MTSGLTTAGWAGAYLALGWCPIPVLTRDKRPGWDGRPQPAWQALRVERAEIPRYFAPDTNIGVNLGEPSNGLADVDLDCPEAIELADLFLPETWTFGRTGKQRSHRLYLAPGTVTEQLHDPETKGMLVELRGTPASNVGRNLGGSQTVFPRSVHKDSGEPIDWADDSDAAERPRELDAPELQRRVRQLAVSALIVRYSGPAGLAGFLDERVWPALPPQVEAAIREWCGLRVQLPRRKPARRGAGGGWIAEINGRSPSAVAEAAGLAIRERAGKLTAECPACESLLRSSRGRDRRGAINLRESGSWHCFLCGAGGDAAALVAFAAIGRKPTGAEDWHRVREFAVARGLSAPRGRP